MYTFFDFLHGNFQHFFENLLDILMDFLKIHTLFFSFDLQKKLYWRKLCSIKRVLSSYMNKNLMQSIVHRNRLRPQRGGRFAHTGHLWLTTSGWALLNFCSKSTLVIVYILITRAIDTRFGMPHRVQKSIFYPVIFLMILAIFYVCFKVPYSPGPTQSLSIFHPF